MTGTGCAKGNSSRNSAHTGPLTSAKCYYTKAVCALWVRRSRHLLKSAAASVSHLQLVRIGTNCDQSYICSETWRLGNLNVSLGKAFMVIWRCEMLARWICGNVFKRKWKLEMSRKFGKTSQGFIVWLNLHQDHPPPRQLHPLSLVYPSASLNLPATVTDPH